jgi:hypothetical protein
VAAHSSHIRATTRRKVVRKFASAFASGTAPVSRNSEGLEHSPHLGYSIRSKFTRCPDFFQVDFFVIGASVWLHSNSGQDTDIEADRNGKFHDCDYVGGVLKVENLEPFPEGPKHLPRTPQRWRLARFSYTRKGISQIGRLRQLNRLMSIRPSGRLRHCRLRFG